MRYIRHLMLSMLTLFIVTLGGSATMARQHNSGTTTPNIRKPRIVVTTDPELDDLNSLIRFLLYSTDYRVEGLIYASSGYHWKGDGKGTKWYVPGREYTRYGLNICPCTTWRWPANGAHHIDDAVDAYAKVYPNLKVHDHNYPSPEELRSKIRYGNIEFDGDISRDTPGSNLIKSLILDDKPGPLYITAQGGMSTIARALKSIQEQYENTSKWPDIKYKVSHKVILLPSGDQDDTYAKYIKPNWPDIEARRFRYGPSYGYGAQIGALPKDSVYLTAAWMKKNVSGRGPLGALYRVWGDGKQMVKGDIFDYFGLSGYTNEELKKMGYIVWLPVQKKGSWLGEGDDPTFMNMLDNGLRADEKSSYGGWAGIEVKTPVPSNPAPQRHDTTATRNTTAPDTTLKGMMSTVTAVISRMNRNKGSYPDFFPAAQNDFAARLKWSVTPRYADANHEPNVSIEGPLSLIVSPGEKIQITGSVSDPDGNDVSVKWFQIQLAGSYPKKVQIVHPTSLTAEVMIPADAEQGQTIHIILSATDNGTPPLTRYQRVIFMVR